MTEKQSYFEFQDGKPVGINIYANNIAKKDFVYNVNKNVIEKNERFFAYLDIIDAQRIVKELNILYKENQHLSDENEQLKKELKELNKKYIAFSEATDKRLKELMVMWNDEL